MRKRRALVVVLAVAFVGWVGYATTFNLDGEFSPTANPERVVERVGSRVTGVAKDTEQTAKRTHKKLTPPSAQGKAGKLYKREMSNVSSE